MNSFKEYIGTTGARIGNYSNVQPIASLGDTPPKKRPGGKNVRGVGLHASYTTSRNERPFSSHAPKKKKEDNTMGGMVQERGAEQRDSINTRKK